MKVKNQKIVIMGKDISRLLEKVKNIDWRDINSICSGT